MSVGYSPDQYQARYPGSYYMVQPILEGVADELDDLSQPYPLQDGFERMLDRADQEVQRRYPGFMGEDELDRYEIQEDDPPYDRDRNRGYYPGSYTRRNLARDFLAALLLAELLRRRRRY